MRLEKHVYIAACEQNILYYEGGWWWGGYRLGKKKRSTPGLFFHSTPPLIRSLKLLELGKESQHLCKANDYIFSISTQVKSLGIG